MSNPSIWKDRVAKLLNIASSDITTLNACGKWGEISIKSSKKEYGWMIRDGIITVYPLIECDDMRAVS